MNPKYAQEIQEFHRNFADWKKKRIVLYGIGRYTATLLEGLEGFHIIGMMDRDPANVGKAYFGLPVLSPAYVKAHADAIVINTAGTYWNLIYQRIKGLGIPVFYRNGERARETQVSAEEDPYWETSLEELKQRISKAEVVSFDFYDTLFSRRMCQPKDVLQLLEKKLQRAVPECVIPWSEVRSRALQRVPASYCLDELYEAMEDIGRIPLEIVQRAKRMELELEQRMLVPRSPILECMRDAIGAGKEVYVITDMYLPQQFFLEALEKEGIRLAESRVLVSGCLGKCKADGSLWECYRERVKGRKALHVGDHPSADVEEAERHGIPAHRLLGAWEMFSRSSLRGIAGRIVTDTASLLMGCVLGRLFRDPFALNATKGIPELRSNFEMGSCIFGPALLTFFQWLLQEARKDGIQRLVFMARDGYFLKEDFEEYLSLCGERMETCYIGISRQLAMTAAIESEEDIWQLADMPYTGSLGEMLEDRFGIRDVKVRSREDVRAYLPRMKEYAEGVRRRYRKYVEGFRLNHQDAVIDLGYYGNNQRYLNQLSGANMKGYYFNADCSEGNGNAALQSMKACFQKEGDATGKESGILKHQIYLESFLTAPYGMVADVAEDGSFRCKEKRQNQLHFREKEEINEGVKAFLREFMACAMDADLTEDREFADAYYRACFEGGMRFRDEVKGSFYNDNAMMHRMEANLFE